MPGRKLLSLCLLTGLLFACAKSPLYPPPTVWTGEDPSFMALVALKIRAPGRRFSGKAMILSSKGRLYAEGFSPLGTPMFSLWVESAELYLIHYPDGKAYRLVLDPPCPELNRLWPYLLQGKLPLDLERRVGIRGAIRLAQGYELRVRGQPPVFKISYRKRTLVEIKVGEKEVELKGPPFHTRIRLKWKKKDALRASEEFPSLPTLSFQPLILKVAEIADIKAD